MQEYPTHSPIVIHSLSTQFTDLSTAYTHVTNKLFYPTSTLVNNAYSGVFYCTANIGISPQPLDCVPILVYTILINIHSEQSSAIYVLSLIHCVNVSTHI